jgi:hypothetical protein
MERHPGVVFFATNFFEAFDPAALRRITFKIRFDPLTADQRRALFVEVLRSRGLENAEAPSELDRLHALAAGDYAVAVRRMDLLGRAFDASTLLAELDEEQRAKRGAGAGPLGFGR